jgi:hypothetical protein
MSEGDSIEAPPCFRKESSNALHLRVPLGVHFKITPVHIAPCVGDKSERTAGF